MRAALATAYGAPLELNEVADPEIGPADILLRVTASGVCPTDLKVIEGGLGANPRVTIHDYDGLGHAFARPGSTHYDAAAAELANGRTYAFLHENLS